MSSVLTLIGSGLLLALSLLCQNVTLLVTGYSLKKKKREEKVHFPSSIDNRD